MTYSELYKKLSIFQKDISIIKSLIEVLKDKEDIVFKGQNMEFSEESWIIFHRLWSLFKKTRETCDYTHMSKLGFIYLFQLLYSGIVLKEFVTIYGIFCPGYEGISYKSRLGNTTLTKMENLKQLSIILSVHEIKHEIVCIYADVFLENEIKSDNIFNEFEFNKTLFFEKSSIFFNKTILLSDFLRDKNIHYNSFIDFDIINSLNKQDYKKFLDCNMQFYKSMGWSEERIKKRNDELITLYVIVAEEIYKKKNSIYATIENIEGRTSLFLNKKVPVLFISKKQTERRKEYAI